MNVPKSRVLFIVLIGLPIYMVSMPSWATTGGSITPGWSKEAVGWHWYNEIKEIYSKDKKDEEKQKKEDGKKDKKDNRKEDDAVVQMAMLRQAVRAAKDKAILYPTVENMVAYLTLQNFVMEKAAMFTRAWKQTLLQHPELDYSVLHPIQNNAQHVLYAQIRKKEDAAIKALGQKYGLLFFYRGNNPLDQELALTIESFCRDNNVSLLPVSVDGKNLTTFANSRIDNGQAKRLGVKHFPALVLIDPKNQKVQPLSYGFVSESDIRRRFLQIATDFDEEVYGEIIAK